MSKIISIFLSLVLFGLYSFIASSLAQVVRPWTNLSSFGGQINDITVDPSNPLKIFAGSYLGSGLFITEDGGDHWQPVSASDESGGDNTWDIFSNAVVWAVKIAAPPHNDVIWVAHDHWIKKSTDGGDTWTHIGNETIQQNCQNCGGQFDGFRFCQSLAIHTSNPQMVYVGTGGPYWTDSPGAIYKTKDGGSNWTKLTLDPDPNIVVSTVIDLAINPNVPNIVWALTSSSIYRSEDAGNNWSCIDRSKTYYDIEIKPNNPNEIFVACYEGIFKVYQDQDPNEWQSVSIAPDSQEVRALAFDPQNPEVLYAAWRNRSEGNHPVVAKGVNGGIDWEWELYLVDYKFKTLTVHPANSEVIFGGEFELGVYRSTDHGQTWTSINNGINAVRVYDIDINPNNRSHILAATSIGVFEKKGDEGWSLISNFEDTAAFSVTFHPNKDQTYYAGIYRKFAKTTDGGVNWTYTDTNTPGNIKNYVSDIAIHPTNTDPQTTVIFISVHGYYDEIVKSKYGDIYKSMDGGDTLIKVHGEKYCFNTVAIDPSDPNHIFAGGGNFTAPVANGALWESSDGGVVWERTVLQDVVVNSLLINPNDPNIIYAGCGDGSGTDIPLYISRNGGEKFEPSFDGMYQKTIPLYAVWGDTPDDVFFVGEKGLIFYYNGTWIPMFGTQKTLGDIWGALPNDIFAVGKEGIIQHYDGAWSNMNSWTIEDLWGIWGTSPTDVFAVGANGTILHCDGIWSNMASNTTKDLRSVWGTSPTDVFAVGANGTILHYDRAWSAMDSTTTRDLWGVWGTSPTDVFAVGANGTILHYDGIWSAMDSNTRVSLSKVWGSSPTDIFIVGSDNMILHYDGNSWAKIDIDMPVEDYLDIWGFSGSDVFVTGNKGNILHYDGNVWTIFMDWWVSGNSVIDLEFHPQNKNVIYAGTPTMGIYISPNQGENWLDLGSPDYYVLAIATSSLYAGTEGGLWQCTGTGIIAGQVRDNISDSAINKAFVYNDWVKTISINGEYMMVSPAGICDITAIADDYYYKIVNDVNVYGGDISWVNFGMQSPISLPDSSNNKGGGGSTCFIASAARF